MTKNDKACCTPTNPESSVTLAEPIDFADSGSTSGMRCLEGGAFLMGTDRDEGFPADGEGPAREVTLRAFHIDITRVTNRQFANFVKDSSYRTDAEKFNWSFVFHQQLAARNRKHVDDTVFGLEWWCKVSGTNWRHPEGPGSNIKRRMDNPVVHASWNDAIEYCRWAGKRLPTEAEWEYAVRGGLVRKIFPWGNELKPGGKHQCNIWQGEFPAHNTCDDGYAGTAPVRSFKPNGYGLYNMVGNVWEWCGDWFSPDFHLAATRDNPVGPERGDRKVMRGGSFLCHDSYCNRYRCAARTANTPDSSTENCGFRCVRDA